MHVISTLAYNHQSTCIRQYVIRSINTSIMVVYIACCSLSDCIFITFHFRKHT